jgi:hypothetical protein
MATKLESLLALAQHESTPENEARAAAWMAVKLMKHNGPPAQSPASTTWQGAAIGTLRRENEELSARLITLRGDNLKLQRRNEALERELLLRTRAHNGRQAGSSEPACRDTGKRPPEPMIDYIRMQSRYQGVCQCCFRPFSPGDSIWWKKNGKSVTRCDSCGPG